mmetsp:Transcript_52972/g.139583  ORF Transcript_52972/g.139583 Transcript_52972/m.139583 type:complete len:187 (-) Transcript_52972:1246-1806(-)
MCVNITSTRMPMAAPDSFPEVIGWGAAGGHGCTGDSGVGRVLSESNHSPRPSLSALPSPPRAELGEQYRRTVDVWLSDFIADSLPTPVPILPHLLPSRAPSGGGSGPSLSSSLPRGVGAGVGGGRGVGGPSGVGSGPVPLAPAAALRRAAEELDARRRALREGLQPAAFNTAGFVPGGGGAGTTLV